MESYQKLLGRVRYTGVLRGNRTGADAYSCFSADWCCDLASGFPLLTTKKMFFKGIATELLWFISGTTNIKYLQDNDVHIWDEWADSAGEVGPMYGKQWRDFGGVDQLAELVKSLQTDPLSRRHMLAAWNPPELEQMSLAPCHVLAQFYVLAGRLHCQVYQRSADIFLGVPFNIASYALLVHMLAQVTGLQPGKLFFCFGDIHLYNNHTPQAAEQLKRAPMRLPVLKLNPEVTTLEDFALAGIEITDYKYHGPLPADIAV